MTRTDLISALLDLGIRAPSRARKAELKSLLADAQAKSEAAEREAQSALLERLARDLRAGVVIEPDVPPPCVSVGGATTGWDYNPARRVDHVYRAWSTSIIHGEGAYSKYRDRGGGSQRPIPLYSTRILALQALMLSMARQYAGILRGIEIEIDIEEE